ncbi:MAG: hypothetical protein JNK82_04355 [Myxococcaceae bacterium]|nr:hypothetical protein [Myxococcaceae bacterium]
MPSNDVIAHTLQWLSVLLEIDGSPRDRVDAYRQAVKVVRELEQPAADLIRRSGAPGLEVRGVPAPIAKLVADWVLTGKLPVSQPREAGLWPALSRALCGALGIEPQAKKKAPVAVPAFHRPVWESWQ